MAEIIGLPKLSPTMEEGVLIKWVKNEGDSVEPGDLVAEVETDKANMDFNMEDEGVLLKLLVNEGDTVRLGAPVAILGEKGEDISELVKQAEAWTGASTGATTGSAAPAQAARPEKPASSAAAPAPAKAAAGAGVPTAAAATASSGGRLLASPLAKTLAIELGIDLRTVTGSGPGGRIVERDVRAAADGTIGPGDSADGTIRPVHSIAGGGAAAAEAPAASTALAVTRVPAPAPRAAEAHDEYRDEPLSGTRKTIAQRMLEAKRDIPHFYLTRGFDPAPMLGFRKRLNELMGDRGKVSVNDLIIKAIALALRRVPDCNASFIGTAIRYHQRVHIGVAVATERGLVTPVVRDADMKGVGVIAGEIRDLAGRARDRRLKVHEIQGSTFTVSNLGMYGIEEFAAIVNPPEGGILAVGTIVDVPVVRDGELVAGKRMTVTLSCDHRVIDGALGAVLLREFADLIEKPESLAL